MKRDIDEILRKKSNEIKFDYKFKIEDNKKQTKMIYRLAACFIVIFLIGFNVYYLDFKENLKENDDLGKKLDEYNKLPIASQIIEIDSNNFVTKGILNANNIVIAKIDDIVGYEDYIPKYEQYCYPITCIKATIINTLKGNLTGTFNFYKSGGIIPLKDCDKILNAFEIEKLDLNAKSEEEKENTYVEIKFSSDYKNPEIQIGHTYMLLLNYDNTSFNMYTVDGFEQRIFEYDTNTNKVKDQTLNEWIQLNKFY